MGECHRDNCFDISPLYVSNCLLNAVFFLTTCMCSATSLNFKKSIYGKSILFCFFVCIIMTIRLLILSITALYYLPLLVLVLVIVVMVVVDMVILVMVSEAQLIDCWPSTPIQAKMIFLSVMSERKKKRTDDNVNNNQAKVTEIERERERERERGRGRERERGREKGERERERGRERERAVSYTHLTLPTTRMV